LMWEGHLSSWVQNKPGQNRENLSQKQTKYNGCTSNMWNLLGWTKRSHLWIGPSPLQVVCWHPST
jgi:hypothetical protein